MAEPPSAAAPTRAGESRPPSCSSASSPTIPPTVPFGRVKPADVDETLRMKSTAPPDKAGPAPPDEQLTIPLGGDDETLRLDRD